MLKIVLRVSVFCLTAASLTHAAKKPVTFDAVVGSIPGLGGHSVPAITWAPDGDRFLLNDKGSLTLYDVPSAKQQDLFLQSKLDAAAIKPQTAQTAEWIDENVHEGAFQWFSDGKRVLASASGDLFVIDTTKKTFEALTQTDVFEHDPKLSPDNRFASFRRGFDLYVVEISSKKVTRVTYNGNATLLNGQTDWVYPEELDLGTAHWWAPDSRSIAYLQFDTSREPVYPQVSLLGTHGVLEPQRYPKAGDPNPEVRLGVVSVNGGTTRWMDLGDPFGNLIARVVWSPAGRDILVERLNRVQNKLDLLTADPATGISHVVIHEEDTYWINLKGQPQFIDKGERFLWTSERSGYRHLYLYGMDGRPIRQLTSGEWEVDQVLGFDAKKNLAYYTSTEAGPTEKQAYSVSIEGERRQLITKGAGTHTPSLSPNSNWIMDDYSGLQAQPRSTLLKSDGTEMRLFRQPDTTDADEFEILPTEITSFKTSDGATLYARMIRPAGFQRTRKYPAIVVVYGGPGVQYVRNTWQGVSWDQVMAHKGYVIWQVDNRGSTGRGHVFETPIYHNMGAQELADQRAGIDFLVGQGFVDASRIGLFGWSYGGFMTLYTITNAPGLIKAAVAGAPVTNFRNYDTIYTERYMGLPDENGEGYKNSSPISKAANIGNTSLLIMHNVEDDNVHFQNSVQMADALENANKQFSMVIYTQKTHHVFGPADRQRMETMASFFDKNLK